MIIEFVLVLILTIFALIYTDRINSKSFLNEENGGYLVFLKEKDYDFYVMAKYGEKVNPNKFFVVRLKQSVFGTAILMILFVTSLSFVNFMAILVVGFILYKSQYIKLKRYYKKYTSQIDQLLPYYLKSLEILCQNYTVPVALSRSIDEAPELFKPGLRDMIASIDAGDSSVQPYMDFALRYPVRDSMRMMRLLYRLGLGAQENKYKQLLIFSKSVSSLQNKAREMKYKSRLDNMEKRTMLMLAVTGGGTMLILLVSMFMLMGS